MIKHQDPGKVQGGAIPDGSASGSQPADSVNAQVTQKSQDKNAEEKKKEGDKVKKESMSIHSQLTSSLMETSEDEEVKRKEAQKAAKAKKGFTEEELNQIIDVELKETNTITLMVIPGTAVNHDTEEHVQATADNKTYEQLKQNKIGSDSYTVRGTQTLNLT